MNISELNYPINATHHHIHNQIVFNKSLQSRLGQCLTIITIHTQADWIGTELVMGFCRVYTVEIVPERLIFGQFTTTTQSIFWRHD